MTETRTGRVAETLVTTRLRIEGALERAREAIVASAPAALAEPIRYALDARGKRLRPMLCVAAYEAAGGPSNDPVYDLAAALEVVHTYSLVHDDLPCMDNDDLRRGRATLHRAFGAEAATLAGAALIPHACALLDRASCDMGLRAHHRRRLLRELTRAAGAAGMVGGQLLDLDAEGEVPGVDALQDIHRRKTGALFCASLRMGGIAAGAEDPIVDALGDCGRWLGLAFQITDDLLDETGRSDVLGKAAGRDRERAKATFPGLLGLAEARKRAEHAAARAYHALDEAGLDDPVLRGLIRFAVERNR